MHVHTHVQTCTHTHTHTHTTHVYTLVHTTHTDSVVMLAFVKSEGKAVGKKLNAISKEESESGERAALLNGDRSSLEGSLQDRVVSMHSLCQHNIFLLASLPLLIISSSLPPSFPPSLPTPSFPSLSIPPFLCLSLYFTLPISLMYIRYLHYS